MPANEICQWQLSFKHSFYNFLNSAVIRLSPEKVTVKATASKSVPEAKFYLLGNRKFCLNTALTSKDSTDQMSVLKPE